MGRVPPWTDRNRERRQRRVASRDGEPSQPLRIALRGPHPVASPLCSTSANPHPSPPPHGESESDINSPPRGERTFSFSLPPCGGELGWGASVATRTVASWGEGFLS